MKSHILVIVICGGSLFAAGCGWFESSTAESDGRRTVSVTFNQAEFERDRAEFQHRAESTLQELDGNIAELEARAQAAAGEARVEIDAEIARQKANLEKARAELRSLQDATAEKWADFKARSSDALEDLHKGIRDAASRFQ